MDYEKKYREALKKAEAFYYSATTEPITEREVLANIFPELKESEDEKIRKEIISALKNANYKGVYDKHLYWLEKQGKSSSTIHYWTEEEIEPIISDYLRGAEHYGGMIGRLRCLKPKSLEKQCEWKTDDKIEPKFKEGDKIISTISNIPYYITEVCNGHYLTDVGCVIMFNAQDNFELSNPNPAWSEEDEKKRTLLISILEVNHPNAYFKVNPINTLNMEAMSVEELVDWLKSLKDKVQPKQEWSEEDKRMHQYVVNDLRFVKELVNDPHYVVSVERVEKEIDWMESLKERIGG